MSLLDELGKQVLGNVRSGDKASPASGSQVDWLQLAMGLLNQYGGIRGLITKFQQGGLGDLVASWVSTGPNPPISSTQVKEVLGPQLPQVAQEAGTDTQTAAIGIAQVLPGLIDQLTPNGEPVEGDALQQGIKALLGGKFGNIFG